MMISHRFLPSRPAGLTVCSRWNSQYPKSKFPGVELTHIESGTKKNKYLVQQQKTSSKCCHFSKWQSKAWRLQGFLYLQKVRWWKPIFCVWLGTKGRQTDQCHYIKHSELLMFFLALFTFSIPQGTTKYPNCIWKHLQRFFFDWICFLRRIDVWICFQDI